MLNLKNHLEDILAELKRISAIPNFYGEMDEFPSSLTAGDQGEIFINNKIGQSIKKISAILLQNDPGAAQRFTNTEWGSLVEKSLGEPLADADLDDPNAADTILKAIREAIDAARLRHGVRDYAVGCTLFANDDIEPIRLGPVLIEPRGHWLSRMVDEHKIDKIIGRRVLRAWAGKKAAKRKNLEDQTREKDILEIVGMCPFVCSVITTGLPPKSGEQKALTAGRMALAAIALVWARPAAVLDGFRLQLDQNLRSLRVLTFEPGRVTLAGYKIPHLPFGYRLEPGEWAQHAKKLEPFFETVGEILSYVIHDTSAVRRPALCNVLMQALLWFHEACREAADAMAVVKFVAVLDALAGGKGQSRIQKLLSARVGWNDNDKIFKNESLTMKQAVAQIYGEGRSRTVHGTNERLSYDCSEMRNLAETLSRHALIGCLYWSVENRDADDPGKLCMK